MEKRLPDRTEAAPATVASTERPARLVEPDAAALCQKYFPNVGQMVLVPCRRLSNATAPWLSRAAG